MTESLPVIFLSAIAVFCAFNVIFQKNPVVCAIYLLGTFLGLGGLYLTLQAPFIAAIQILVYAGAITVLFIFVIMLLNVQKDPDRFTPGKKLPRLIALFIIIWLIFSFIHLTAFPIAIPGLSPQFSVAEVSKLLFTKYIFPFELASYLLLISMVGGVVLAKKKKETRPKENQND